MSDTNLVKLLQKLLDAMGPLSKIWTTAESAKTSQDEQVVVSLGDMLRYLDISYTRRFNVLKKQITRDPRKTKKILKEKKEIFESENHYLLGEKFETDLVKTAKSRHKSREVLTTMGNKQPFRKSHLSQTYQPNKGKGRILGCCSQKVVHNRQGEKAGMNRVVTDPSSRVTNKVK